MQIDALRAGQTLTPATAPPNGSTDFSALLAEADGAAAGSGMGRFSATAHADPAFARRFTHDLVYDSDLPLIDISGLDPVTGRGARYTLTGEPVTAQSEAWHQAVSTQARSGRIALYEQEQARGTPPAEILDHVIRYMDAQPARYLQHLNWTQRSGRV